MFAGRLSACILFGASRQSAIQANFTGFGDRAFLDQLTCSDVCLDLYIGRAWYSNDAEWIGLEGVRLINTPGAVLVGMVYGYLPLMIFPIYVSLERLDKQLLEASGDLGASPFKTFMQVTFPLSLPGVSTGCMLVFILLMGEFLIPAFLGGGKVFFIGNAMVDLFLQSRNWPFGAAIAVTLVSIMLIVVTMYMRISRRGHTGRDESLM